VERIPGDIDAHGGPWNGPAVLVPTASDVEGRMPNETAMSTPSDGQVRFERFDRVIAQGRVSTFFIDVDGQPQLGL
jgi:hypothetical protein